MDVNVKGYLLNGKSRIHLYRHDFLLNYVKGLVASEVCQLVVDYGSEDHFGVSGVAIMKTCLEDMKHIKSRGRGLLKQSLVILESSLQKSASRTSDPSIYEPLLANYLGIAGINLQDTTMFLQSNHSIIKELAQIRLEHGV